MQDAHSTSCAERDSAPGCGEAALLDASSPSSNEDANVMPSPDSGLGRDAGSPRAASCANAPAGHFRMERLDRGVIAVRVEGGNFVGFRRLGHEYAPDDPGRVRYRVYRDGQRLATLEGATNYLDPGGSAQARYAVAALIGDAECERSREVATLPQPYLSIPLTPPPGGTTPDGVPYAYNTGTVVRSSGAVNDGSPGDVDGDGEYELIVSWEPDNAKDNAHAGYTGPVYLDCYKLSGERLWRMNLGPNIRAGAHYTQFLVYDLDGDGRAEVALKTAPGTRDGTGTALHTGPAADDDDSRDYRSASGYVLSGPEYLTVFEGSTGRELATVPFEVARGDVADWGDSYGNRVDRFLASVGFVSDLGHDGAGSGRPVLLMARGYYTRATVTAYTFRDGVLRKLWQADSKAPGSAALAGQGAHSMAVADVDGDGAQEIVYGSAMIQSDGSFGCSTGFGHGDALHVSDLVPDRPGLEVFMPHESKSQPRWALRAAEDCEVLQVAQDSEVDNGRGVAANVAPGEGAEFWSAGDDALRSAATGSPVASKPRSINFVVFWDGDELRELLDGVTVTRADGTELLRCSDCMSNNHTKATPVLTADLFGDYREEIVWRTPDSSALRIYTATSPSDIALFTLMHDPQYRMQVTSEQTGYNQPPHPSFLLERERLPPPPDIRFP